MSKFNLDLKKFKHVKSDDKSTTLQHADGHIITIAHKPLSKELLKQISSLPKEKMAEGGPVDKKQQALNLSSEFRKKQYSAETFGNTNETEAFQKAADHFEDKATQEGAARQQARKTAMADGGAVRWDNYKAPSSANPKQVAPSEQKDYHDKTTPDEDKQRHQQQDEADAKGKAMGLYADGGDVDPNQVMTPNPNYQQPYDAVQAQPQAQAPVPAANPYKDVYNKFYDQIMTGAPGTPHEMADQQAMSATETQMAADKSNAKIADEDAQMGQQKIIELNQRRQAIGLEPLPVPAVPSIAGAGQPVQKSQQDATLAPIQQAQQGIAQAKGEQMPGMGGSHDPESMLSAGFSNQMAGISQQAKATGELGQAQAASLQKGIDAQQMAQQSFQHSYQALENERQAHMQDIKDGYVDPNAYWKDHSKVMSGIGMILAGFNPTNSPNAAINFLKYQMDQNIEAQKSNLGAKQNMLAANLHQFGNLRDAMDMTRVMQNDIMSHELQAAAAKAQTPMAKAAALQAAGQLQIQTAPLFQSFAMRRAMMNLANNGGTPDAVDHMLGYMRVVNPEMAKEMETRYIPHVGLASVPVPEAVRSNMVAKQQFGEAVKDLQSWAIQHSGSLSPSSIAEGKTKAANVQNLYRQGINGGVFKQGEQSFINNIVDADPTKFFNSIRVIPKLNEVMRENDNSMNVLKKSYGLPQQQAAQAPQYKVDKNGVKWMRGPKGEAIRVK